MTKNANQHSKTKQRFDVTFLEITMRKENHYEKGNIEIDYVSIDFQLADIFTKPFDYNRFSFICGELNVCIIGS